MHDGDPRFALFPSEPGLGQLRWYIRHAAEGQLTIQEFLQDFRKLHEAAERAGAPAYASPEEARAIWDVLWAVEFCAPDTSTPMDNPEDWYIPEEVLVIVQRAVKHLAA